MRKLKVILCLFILSFSISSFAKYNGDYLNKITTKYITPHLNWAKPLSKGKIKALFIVPRRPAREVVEIWERMDLDIDAFIVFHSGALAIENMYEGAIEGTTNYEKKQEIIKKIQNKYDVYIFGNVMLDILPSEAKYKILKNVKDGAGLVFFYNNGTKYKKIFSNPTDEAEKISENLSFQGFPSKLRNMEPSKLIKTYKFGKGKIIVIDYPERVSTYWGGLSLTQREDYSGKWKGIYENSMALVAKSILWAADKTPSISVYNNSFSDNCRISQDDFNKEKVKISLVGKKGTKGKITIRIRNELNEINYKKSFKYYLKDGKDLISFYPPFLPSGKYYFDFLVETKNGVDNFGYWTFNINSYIGKASINTDKISYENGENVKAEITTENPVKDDCEVILQLSDSPYKKIWMKKELSLPAGRKKLNISLTVKDFPTIAGYLECEIVSKKGTLGKVRKELFFPKREKEIFPRVLWDGSNTWLPEFYEPQILNAGFTAALNHPTKDGENAKIAAIFNLKFVPYMYRIGLTPDKNGWTQEFWLRTGNKKNREKYKGDGSFYNPIVQQASKNVILQRIKNLPLYGPLVYSLGDENFYRYGGGYSPSEEKEFKKYLKEKYKNIEKLNKEWETNFESFDNVKHYKIDECRKEKKYAAWFDVRYFIDKEYGDYHHYLTKVIKEVDPYARVGAEGSMPGDLEYTISKLKFWGPYGDKIMNELLRSIGPDKFKTNWWGGYVGSHGGRNSYPYPLWQPLLCGIVNGNSWYSTGPSSEGFLSVDLSYAKYFSDLLPRLKTLYNGIAQILILNKLRNDGIAIHWSYTSYTASFMDERFFNPKNSTGAFINFAYRNGLNFDFLTTKMIESGDLKNYKILFLFGSSSISDTEKERIENFVKNGGIVVADLNPGILDGYCKYIGKSQLSDVFGAEIKGKEKFALSSVNVNKEVNGTKISFKADKVFTSPETDVFHINNYGTGHGILLNFNLASALNTSSMEEFDNFLLNLLSTAGIKKQVNITGVSKDSLIVRIRKNPDCDILGILVSKKDIDKKIKIDLRSEKFVYKPEYGFIKKGKTIEEKITEPFIIFSLFDKKVPDIKVKIKNKRIKRGGKIYISLPEMKKGRLIRISIGNEKGNIYNKVIILKNNSLLIPVAYNEKTGNYKIEITDVLTGLKAKEKIKLI